MSAAQPTSGPWLTMPEECDRPYIRVRGTLPGLRFKVANVLTPVYEGVHAREVEETRANASLIAAAPDLLAACKLWVAYQEAIDSDDPKVSRPLNAYGDAMDATVVAIAKATGSAA